MRPTSLALISLFITSIGFAQETLQIDESTSATATQKPRNHAKQPHGKWVWSHQKTNTTYLIGHYRNGVKHGQWTYHFTNGKPVTRGTYHNGKRTDTWVRWHNNGAIAATGKYKSGQKHGKWTYWYNNKRTWRTGSYRNGREDGLWIEWHDNGNKHRHTTFIADPGNPITNVLHGLHQSWYENGKPKERGNYVFGKKEGIWKYWNDKGKLTTKRYKKLAAQP